jgi:hypothetical protein
LLTGRARTARPPGSHARPQSPPPRRGRGAFLAVAWSLLALVAPFALAEPLNPRDLPEPVDALRDVRSTRIENQFTKVPTTGKLVSVKMTDSGRTYYICREGRSYVIYHLEIRPIEGLKDQLDLELKELRKRWDDVIPEELLFTKKRHETEIQRRIRRYSEAVWVRNRIVEGENPEPPPAARKEER